MQKQYRIEGWEQEQIFAPISHRHQLKPLQQILSKAEKQSKDKHRQQSQVPKQLIKDESSFTSLKSNRKKYYTEEIQIQSSKEIKDSRDETKQKDKTMRNFNFMHISKTKATSHLYNNLATLIDKQPTITSHSSGYILRHIRNISSKILEDHKTCQERSQQQKSEKFQRKRPQKPKINSEQCLVIVPNKGKDESIDQLKSFFLKTLNRLEKKSQEKSKKRMNYDNRLKKVLGKSNKRKKELKELFKTRTILVDKGEQSTIKVPQLTANQDKSKPKQKLKRILTEFDDQSLYCPWTLKEDRLTQHLKSKCI